MLRVVPNVMFCYDAIFYVNRNSVANQTVANIDGTDYYYAPLFTLSASDAAILLGDFLPATNGETVSITRMPEGKTRRATINWRVYRYSQYTYLVLDDSLRATSAAELLSLIQNNQWSYADTGTLHFLYAYSLP